jgi:type I restriction enzyme S subunit
MGTSGSMKKLSMRRVRVIEVPVPDRTVQERWTPVRNTLRAALANVHSLLEAKRAFKRALLQELLTGRRRFPGFDSEVQRARLGDVLTLNPAALPGSTDPAYSFRYIDLSSIQQGRHVAPPRPMHFGEAPSRARRLVREHDVLFATVRPNLQGHAIVEETSPDLVCSTGFMVLRAANPDDARYVFELLFSEDVQRQASARIVGSSFPALSVDDVASMELPWPCAAERKLVGRTLALLSKEIAALERLREAQEKQKRALMHRLLSGDLTLPAPAPELAHA